MGAVSPASCHPTDTEAGAGEVCQGAHAVHDVSVCCMCRRHDTCEAGQPERSSPVGRLRGTSTHPMLGHQIALPGTPQLSNSMGDMKDLATQFATLHVVAPKLLSPTPSTPATSITARPYLHVRTGIRPLLNRDARPLVPLHISVVVVHVQVCHHLVKQELLPCRFVRGERGQHLAQRQIVQLLAL